MKPMAEVRIALWSGSSEGLTAVECSLTNMGCRVERVWSYERLAELLEEPVDVVVVECENAADILHWMRGVRLAGTETPPVLTLASARDVRKYLSAMNLGAFDCVGLPIHERELHRVIRRAVDEPRHETMLLGA